MIIKALPPHPKKPQSDPLAKELHKLFSLALQVFFHRKPSIESFNIVTQIERLGGPNRQSSAYSSTSASL